jgi:hypothetical protein
MSIIIDFIIVFFFIVGVISTAWIVWEYVDEWLSGKDLMLPKLIYNYQHEQVFYDKYLGEIIFFSFGQPFCRIRGRSLFYKFAPDSALYDVDVKCAICELIGFSIPWCDLPVNYEWNEVKFRNERDFLRQIQRIKG